MDKLACLLKDDWELAITDLFSGITSSSAKEAYSNWEFSFFPSEANRAWTRLGKQSKPSISILKELFRTCWVKNKQTPNPTPL